MTMRTFSKALLLVTISLGVPAVARPALAGVHRAEGRRHHHRHHERRHEHRHEQHEHARDGERHGEL